MTDTRPAESVLKAIPKAQPNVVTWAEEHVRFPGSARSQRFKISVTPWLREPLERATDLRTRIVTMMKPVQSGGSVLGEILLMFWFMFSRGMLQYNWSNDKRAKDRWNSRVKGIFEACDVVNARMDNIDYKDCEIDFGNVFFRQQGAFTPDNLDSDSIALQVNEEVHSWEPGHLKKARARSTAVWNFKSVDISNAGVAGDQLDQAFCAGTGQHWNVLCPGCGKFHRMRTKWEDNHPELGGLRYDADNCRLPGQFNYNYNKLRPTIRFQMPCGFVVQNDDISTRRKMSLGGKYEEPQHEGSIITHRSYTYEAVCVDYIDWLTLVQEKHDGLRARSLGDPQPWMRYKQERECIPYDPDDVPIINVITTIKGIKKNREGLSEPRLRLFALDRQAGVLSHGEFPHWWVLMRDFKIENNKLRSLLIYEGKIETDAEVVEILKDHKCNMWQGVADSGDDTAHVYAFCAEHGINAIKGGKEDSYVHESGGRRIFSPERPLYLMVDRPPKFPLLELSKGKTIPDPREAHYWLYSKHAIRERLAWLRAETIYETPDDVSDDYRRHQEAEQRQEYISPTDGSRSWRWVQIKKRNDLFVCEAYIAMLVDQAGIAFTDQPKN